LSQFAPSIQRASIENLRQTGLKTRTDVKNLLGWLREPKVGTRHNCLEADHSAPFDFIADVLTGRVLNYLAWANRGGSKSYLAGLTAWVLSSFFPRLETTILGGSLDQSEKVYKAMEDIWILTALQDEYLKGDPTRRLSSWRNGSRVAVLTASTRSTRGPHPQHLIMDEIDEMPAEVYRAALSQPQSRHGIFARLGQYSTNHRSGGMMDEALEQARIHRTPIYRWCVTGDTLVKTERRGDIPIKEIRLGEKVWTLEGFKPLSFVGITGYNGVYRIKTGANRELQCTAEHLIFTDAGWRRADELKTGEQIIARLSAMRQTERASIKEVPCLFHDDTSGNPPAARGDRPRPGGPEGEWEAMQGPDIQPGDKSQDGQKPTGSIQKRAGLEQGETVVPKDIGGHPSGTGPSLCAADEADINRENIVWDSRRNGDGLDSGNKDFLLAGRYVHPGAKCSHRSERRLLALLAEKYSKRRTQADISGEPRLPCSFPDGDGTDERGSQAEIIELDRIIEIEYQPAAVAVYDLTIKDGPPHFFANGILVHNCIWECLEPCRDYACSTCKLSSWCPGTQMKQADGYYLIQDFVDKLEHLSENSLQVEWLCRKVGADNLVYGEQYDPKIHSRGDLPVFDPERHVLVSIDWGGTAPFSLGAWQLFNIGWVRVDEIYQPGDNPHLIATAQERRWWPNIRGGVADPSRPDLMSEWRAKGIPMVDADNDVDIGLEAVRKGFRPVIGPPTLWINQVNRHWISEEAGYIQRRGKPVKERDHAMDETRYFAMWQMKPTPRKGKIFVTTRAMAATSRAGSDRGFDPAVMAAIAGLAGQPVATAARIIQAAGGKLPIIGQARPPIITPDGISPDLKPTPQPAAPPTSPMPIGAPSAKSGTIQRAATEATRAPGADEDDEGPGKPADPQVNEVWPPRPGPEPQPPQGGDTGGEPLRPPPAGPGAGQGEQPAPRVPGPPDGQKPAVGPVDANSGTGPVAGPNGGQYGKRKGRVFIPK
jgi:hypothetical protein